jgi:polysaccharide export outer membrane protein
MVECSVRSACKLSGPGRFIVGCLVVGVALSGCATSGKSSTEQPELSSVPAVDLPLMPGDAIRVSFSEEPGLNGEFAIDETGTISLPLLGARIVVDQSAAAVKAQLAEEYARRTRNQSIQVVYLRRVRVLGEVRNPGLYHIDPTMTFDDAIALAGGSNSVGNLKKVTLVRDGEELAEGLDVTRSVSTAVHSGDQIYVPKTSWFSRYGAIVIGATIAGIATVLAFAVF